MKMEVFGVKMAVLGEGVAEKTKRKARDASETKKFLENCLSFNPICARNFRDSTDLQVSRQTKSPKSLEPDFEIFLQVFFVIGTSTC